MLTDKEGEEACLSLIKALNESLMLVFGSLLAAMDDDGIDDISVDSFVNEDFVGDNFVVAFKVRLISLSFGACVRKEYDLDAGSVVLYGAVTRLVENDDRDFDPVMRLFELVTLTVVSTFFTSTGVEAAFLIDSTDSFELSFDELLLNF